MMQRFFRSLTRLITKTFFRRIDVVGAEHIPGDGPVIFAGNHPNALMDGWLLTATCGRWPVHFMANAKLWDYPLMPRILNATGAVPVYRREEHGDKADNSGAFDRLFEVLEDGDCMGVFPEGISHVESQLIELKTGTARIALGVAARGKVDVKIVPCGLGYTHRHRYRSQALIEYGEPIEIGKEWLERYAEDPEQTVRDLTEHLADCLRVVTVNAPDWQTLRFVQAARRLYKPSSVVLTPAMYAELNRRFIAGYLRAADDPDVAKFRDDVENYQTRLEVLGLKDYQLRGDISIPKALKRLAWRAMSIAILFPLAIPGALLHLPVGWAVATMGRRFSYEQDDIATIKVFATLTLAPLSYIIIGILLWIFVGPWWALGIVSALVLSFSATSWLIEAQAHLLTSIVSILRRTRIRNEIEALRGIRARLVDDVRELAGRLSEPGQTRMFSADDFGKKR